jgi:hypothetical protein
MKVLILYRPVSEHGRMIEQFIRDFEVKEGSINLEVVDVDTRDGMATASLYDIMSYPAIMVLQNDGYMHKLWQGGEMPLMDELAAYARV